MTASNLSICVGPSLIWTQDQSYMMDQNYSKEVSALVQILIEQYPSIWSEAAPDLFQERGIEAEVPRARSAEAAEDRLEAAGPAPAERTSSLSSTKSENAASVQGRSKKGETFSVAQDAVEILLDVNRCLVQIGQFIIRHEKSFSRHC